jgi:serine/threonine protein kinase
MRKSSGFELLAFIVPSLPAVKPCHSCHRGRTMPFPAREEAPMARPTTVAQFLHALAKSGLMSASTAKEVLAGAPSDTLEDPQQFAEYFVRLGKLSHFQARKLLDGTWSGLVLGPYQIIMPIGRGGMGTVYLARDTQSPRLLALKILPPRKARQSERLIARFLREMELSQRVEHPNLTQTYDVGQAMGVYYIAMEFIAGVNLFRVVTTGGPLPVRRAAKLFAQAAAGLDAAHRVGLIHRDLKPSNLMVTPRDQVKILDLGLAIMADEEAGAVEVIGGRGYVVGSMDYIAPGQTEDSAAVDARSDLYGLGCTIYFALTGQPPFPGGDSKSKIKRHRRAIPPPLQELNPLVSADFAAVIHPLLSKQPGDRPESAAELRRQLLPFADPEPPPYAAPMPANSEFVADLEKDQPDDAAWDWIPTTALSDSIRTEPAWQAWFRARSQLWWLCATGLTVLAIILLIVVVASMLR